VSGVVSSVTFERDARNRAVISWTVAGNCDRVDVAWAITPDGIDHRPVETVPAAHGSVVIDEVPPGRIYVAVGPAGAGGAMIAGERNLGLRGARNFRDLGGYQVLGGARTRWGRVFRSDALILEDLDFDTFASLGIRTVYDLRSDQERESTPNRLPDPSSHISELVSLMSESAAPPPLDELIGDGEAFLADVYLHILKRSATSLGRILSGLADETRLPAVFHCAAGKDRTGMVAALLLSVLGVPEQDILDDYELTSRYRTSERLNAVMERLRTERGVPPEVAAGILRTPRWAMQSVLADIRQNYGDVEQYLIGPAALDPSVPDRLRRLLLTER
jgi:protein-tyrosine phosphatase